MKKVLLLVLTIIIMSTAVGCSEVKANFPYITIDDVDNYNKSLYYQNDLATQGADPSVIYISDKSSAEYGWFYMYCTTDYYLDTRGVCCWKSKDLQSWDFVSVAYYPENESWSRRNIWAPEVIYDESDGKYYMFYSARDEFNTPERSDGTDYLDFAIYNTTKKCIGLAVSDTPYGPFSQFVTNDLPISKPLVSHEKLAEKLLNTGDDTLSELISVIDASPFIDSNGNKYLFFSRSHVQRNTTSVICGMKMDEWWQPDFTTATQLTSCEKKSVINGVNYVEPTEWYESGVNEGPFMIENNGSYYLTLSVNGYDNKLYSVIQAKSDSPLGPFTKLSQDEGAFVLQAEASWDYASGTGHHSFVQAENELWVVYHAHLNRQVGAGQRAMASDRVFYVPNGNGETVLYSNGPTYSPQPLPAISSKYKNIAGQAKVSVSNIKSGNSSTFLTDKLYKVHNYYNFVKEVEFERNGKITLKFDDYRNITAVMIVNSIDGEKYFETIDNIALSFSKKNKSGKTVTGIANTGVVTFNAERYMGIDGSVNAGSAAIVEFEKLSVREITITLPSYSCAVNEIIVLGE